MQARIIAGIIIIVGLVGYLAFVGFEEGRSYYVTCDEVAAAESEFTNTNLKLAGVVVYNGNRARSVLFKHCRSVVY